MKAISVAFQLQKRVQKRRSTAPKNKSHQKPSKAIKSHRGLKSRKPEEATKATKTQKTSELAITKNKKL